MKILLDTHVINWALTDDKRLPQKIKELCLNPDNIVYFSFASLWEIAIKNFKNPILCPYDENTIYEKCFECGFSEMPIKKEHIFNIKSLKVEAGCILKNFDHFDRILLSQSKFEDCYFVTADSKTDNYDEPIIYKI